jgi:hypothetical protein
VRGNDSTTVFVFVTLNASQIVTDLRERLVPTIGAGLHRNWETVARCEHGTRKDLIAVIIQWILEDGSHQPICWLNGPTGSGKSAVSQTVAERYEGRGLVASFFFQGSEGDHIITRLIHTLAFQLSVSVSATKPFIQQALYNDGSITEQSFRYQFKKLLVEPIMAAKAGNVSLAPATLIVIDDIHKCDDKKSMVKFIEIVIDACLEDEDRFPFRILLTSTVEEHLQNKLSAPVFHSIIRSLNIQDFDASDDIRQFFRSQLRRIYEENFRRMPGVSLPWPSDSDIEVLVNRAAGSFLSAVKIVEDIKSPRGTPDQNLIAALDANTSPQASPSRNYRVWEKLRRSSRSSSQHTSASESSHTNSTSPTSPTLPIQREFSATAVRGNGVFGIGSSARAAPLRISTSGSPRSLHTRDRAVSHESPISIPQTAENPIEAATVEGLLEQLILSCESASPNLPTLLTIWPSLAIEELKKLWEPFFAPYTAFITADKVCRVLVDQFNGPRSDDAQHRTHLRIQ